MALNIGYAETSLPAGPSRRFLLELDLSVVNTDAEPGPTAPVNFLDLDGTSPQASPQLAIAVILRRFSATEKLLEFRIRPLPGHTIVEADLQIWVIDFAGGVFPIAGPPPPEPASFAHVAYRGEPGQAMPDSLTAFLGRRVVGTPTQEPDSETSVALVTTPVAQPLHFTFGQLDGPLITKQGVITSFVSGVYAESAPVDLRAIDPAAAPGGMLGELAVSDPPAAALADTGIGARIRSPHAGDRPLGAVSGQPSGAGGVDRGGHRYKVTFLLANGNESGASDDSGLVTVTDPAVDGSVLLTGVPVAPPLPPGSDPLLQVVGRRIYRTWASPDGDSGEYFRVGAIADNLATTFTDAKADADLVEALPSRLEVDACATRPIRLEGALHLRDGGVEDVYELDLRRVPGEVHVVQRSATTTDPGPRLTWHASDVVPAVQVRLPALRGETRWAEVHARDLPRQLGVHWLLRGSDRARFVIGGRTLEELDVPFSEVALVLASAQRPFRDAPETVCLELVEVRHADGTLDRSRTRIGVRGLRRVEVLLGAPGTHSRDGEGIVAHLLLGPDPGPPPPLKPPPPKIRDRSLRLLRLVDRPQPTGREHTHTWIRAGVLPDKLKLDLRATSEPARPAEDYLGLRLEGRVERVKALSMTDPKRYQEPFDADDQRVWLTVPDTGDEVELVRKAVDPAEALLLPEGQSGVVTLLRLAKEAFLEVAVRNPRGLSEGDDPLSEVDAALVLPREVRIGTPRVVRTFGFAGEGSTATELIDAIAAQPTDVAGGAVRFLTGVLAGERRTVTGVAPGGESLTTDPFPAPPATGDRYALEALEGGKGDGLSFRAGTASEPAAASGRIALRFAGGPLITTRATPQVTLHRIGAPNREPRTAGAAARVVGLRELALTTAVDREAAARFSLDPARLNRSFRVGAREVDPRISTVGRSMARGRIVVLPDAALALVDSDRGVTELVLPPGATVGPVAFRVEPATIADSGARKGQLVGIGLIDGRILSIPTRLRAWQIGPDARLPAPEREPRNWTPPSSWNRSGLKIEMSDVIDVHSLRVIGWSSDNPDDSDDHRFSRSDVTQLLIEQMSPAPPGSLPRLDPLWLWTPSEPPPSDGGDPDSGVGVRISSELRVTLDADLAGQTTSRTAPPWNEVGGSWELKQELQMKGYAGEVSVSKDIGLGDLYTRGDTDAGPGLWFLRVLNALIPPVGASSAFFGNTGGFINSRPRIFA